jgi:hypothetical protein
LTVQNDNPGFFRVAGIDEHTLGHKDLRAPTSRTSPRRANAGFGDSRGMRVALLGAGASPPAAGPLDRSKGLWRR